MPLLTPQEVTTLTHEDFEQAMNLLIRARMHTTPGEWEVTRHDNQPTTVHALGTRVASVKNAPDADWMATLASPWIWSLFHSLLEYGRGELLAWKGRPARNGDGERTTVTLPIRLAVFDEPQRYREAEAVAKALLGHPYKVGA